MSTDGLDTAPVARLLAIVPVVLIAVGVIAFLLGFRLEGRQPVAMGWRVHTVAEDNFAVTAPGVLIVNRQTMRFEGREATALTYVATDFKVDFSVSAVRRPDGDTRPFDEVAKSLGLRGEDGAQRADGLTAFRHNTTRDGERTQALLLFQGRKMYQLMVTSPAASFPAANAERFFGSFRLLANP